MSHLEQINKSRVKKIGKLYHLDSTDVEFVREYARQKGVLNLK